MYSPTTMCAADLLGVAVWRGRPVTPPWAVASHHRDRIARLDCGGVRPVGLEHLYER
jgi:hypothetical protein